MKAQKPKLLRRYTNVSATLYLLQNKKITLLSPEMWDDKNDSFYMRQFKEQKKLKSVLAACFTSGNESYHHWRVFAQGSDGVCIEFLRDRFLDGLKGIKNLRAMPIRYELVSRVEQSRPLIDDLPFLKRRTYKHEEEFRVLYVDSDSVFDTKDFDINLDCIQGVRIGPWMPKNLVKAVKRTIRTFDGCDGLWIGQSSVLENERWKRAALPILLSGQS